MVDPDLNYESGTNGPLESDLLLARDGSLVVLYSIIELKRTC